MEKQLSESECSVRDALTTDPPLALDVNIRHEAPGDRQEGEEPPGRRGGAAVVGGGRAGRHGDHVHGADAAATQQKAAVQEERLPKAHVIPEGGAEERP